VSGTDDVVVVIVADGGGNDGGWARGAAVVVIRLTRSVYQQVIQKRSFFGRFRSISAWSKRFRSCIIKDSSLDRDGTFGNVESCVSCDGWSSEHCSLEMWKKLEKSVLMEG